MLIMKSLSNIIGRFFFRSLKNKIDISQKDWVYLCRDTAITQELLIGRKFSDLPNKPQKLSKKDIDYLACRIIDNLNIMRKNNNNLLQLVGLIKIIYFILVFTAENGINIDKLFRMEHKIMTKKLRMTTIKNGKATIKEDKMGDDNYKESVKIELEFQRIFGAFKNER